MGAELLDIFLFFGVSKVTALDPTDLTCMFATLSDRDRSEAARLLPAIYQELRGLAGKLMNRERESHTLQATALVHEAYLRLLTAEPQKWTDRAHFFRVAAAVMRHVLVDHARRRGREKHGGGATPLALDEAVAVFEERAIDLVALDEALEKLAALDKRKARIVELRFFAGLTIAEVAESLGIASRTVKQDWQFARLWLLREISNE